MQKQPKLGLLLTKDGVAWDGMVKKVVDAIEGWTPAPLPTERAYRDALASFLRAVADPAAARVEVEYRHEGTTADVFLRWTGYLSKTEVFFELKKDLKKKGELDRLVGQIEQLGPAQRNIIVVLFGNTDPGFLGRLTERYRKLHNTDDKKAFVILTK